VLNKDVQHSVLNKLNKTALEFAEVAVVESPVDGAKLLVFGVREGGGIAYVEARERGFWPWWGERRRVVTPLALRDNVRAVELRALDRAGNETRERVSVQGGLGLGLLVLVGAVVFLSSGVFVLWKKRWRG